MKSSIEASRKVMCMSEFSPTSCQSCSTAVKTLMKFPSLPNHFVPVVRHWCPFWSYQNGNRHPWPTGASPSASAAVLSCHNRSNTDSYRRRAAALSCRYLVNKDLHMNNKPDSLFILCTTKRHGCWLWIYYSESQKKTEVSSEDRQLFLGVGLK